MILGLRDVADVEAGLVYLRITVISSVSARNRYAAHVGAEGACSSPLSKT
jgi:hypothetical protein